MPSNSYLLNKLYYINLKKERSCTREVFDYCGQDSPAFVWKRIPLICQFHISFCKFGVAFQRAFDIIYYDELDNCRVMH